MTSEELKERVLSEIGDRTRSDHGWNFRPFLLAAPQLRDYDGEMLWTVLIERSEGGTEGYRIGLYAECAGWRQCFSRSAGRTPHKVLFVMRLQAVIRG
jgi:hypothetical protein